MEPSRSNNAGDAANDAGDAHRPELSRRNFLSVAAVSAAALGSIGPAVAATDKFGRDRDWSGTDPLVYPDPAWEVKDKRFTGMLTQAPLQRIWHGVGTDSAYWCEGPVWMADWGCLLWSDIPNHRVLRWTEDDGHISVYQSESGYANGHARDNQGRLIAMEHDTRRVRRREYDGTWTIKATVLSNPKVFADFAPGTTDDIRCDTGGNIWCAWGWGGPDTNGVRVHHPDGSLLAILHTLEVVANLCFGGSKRNRLFICGSTSLYGIYVNATGHALG